MPGPPPRPVLFVISLVALIAWIGPVTPADGRVEPDKPDFADVAQLDELTGDHATVFRLYWAFFLREPQAEGALYWVERRDRCARLADIADQFAEGAEFATRYGEFPDDDNGNRAFVELIYRNVLGRDGQIGGVDYWSGRLTSGLLSRGDVVLHISQSAEFRARHPYPSDGVPARPCRSEPGSATDREVALTGPVAMALITADSAGSNGELVIHAPTVSESVGAVELIGYHQANHSGALGMTHRIEAGLAYTVMDSRNRDTHRSGAADVAVHPSTPIGSPVAGVVDRAGEYVLYCRYRDGFVVIHPDGRPDLEVKILHMQGVSVQAGDRVLVGDPIAQKATAFPFTSQIDELTGEPSWPHVHIEVVDPTVPRYFGRTPPPPLGGC